MALDIYGKEDVRNILRATYVASEGWAALLGEVLSDPELQQVALGKLLRIYRKGFANAIGAVGLAFGLDSIPVGQVGPLVVEVDASMAESEWRLEPAKSPDLELRDLDLGRFMWTKSQHERREGK